jgi:hypothetical protein
MEIAITIDLSTLIRVMQSEFLLLFWCLPLYFFYYCYLDRVNNFRKRLPVNNATTTSIFQAGY